MSDNNQDKPDDYDVIFDQSADDAKVTLEDADVVYTDIDDGDSQDADGGIFAPEQKKSGKKSSLLLSAVAVVAMVGAGGFVYVAHPELLEQAKNNVTGTDVAPVAVESEQGDVAPVDTPVTDGAAVQPVADVAVPNPESAAAPALPPIENPPSEVVTPLAPDVATATTAVVPTDAVSAAETPVPAVVSDAPVSSPAEGPVAATPPEVTPPADDVKKATDLAVAPTDMTTPPSDIAPAPEVKADQTPTLEAVVAPPVGEATAAPKPEVKAEPKTNTKDDNVVVVASKEEKKVLADAKLDKYFDSPDGKMLKDIPAPSMDPSKGKNESIIIVGKKKHKEASSSSKKYVQSPSVSVQKTDLEPRVVSADRALKLGRLDSAKEMYDELYRLNPRDGRVLMGRAVLFQKMGDVEQARNAYEEVLKVDPDNAEAIVNLAGLIRKEYPAVALNRLLDLRQTNPDNPVVAAQLGVTYADTGNYTDAYKYLSMAAGMEPDNPQHFFNMAVIAEKAGDPKKAIENYEKALEVDAVTGGSRKNISRETIYDRLARLRGN